MYFKAAGEGGPEYNLVEESRRLRRQIDEEKESNVEEPIEVKAEEPKIGEAREKKHSVLLVSKQM